MGAGKFVLENKKGEVVRTFAFDADTLFVVYRHDVRRVEVVTDLKQLEDHDIAYDLLKKTSASGVMRRAIALENGGRFRYAKEISSVTPSLQVKDDSKEQETAIYKYTAYTQLGTLALIFIIGLLIEPLFMHRADEQVVTVMPQELIQQKPQTTVNAAEHKVNPTKHVANKKVESHVKEIPKTLTAKVKSPIKRNAPLRTKIQVEKVGALGVLGGMKNGSKHSAGFNMNAANDSHSASWSGAGQGGSGGMERAIPGHGLIGGTMGQGQIENGGGYGTRGKAGGGRAGYGDMNMGGTGASFFEPVQEEAAVEGGLDKDQIKAVIDRHIGEIIFCYEKGLQVQSALNGRVGIRWVINGAGQVTSAAVESSSLKNAGVEGCIVNHLRAWQFPKPVGGVNVKVSYPFVLKRVNHG